jgi:hypothetical protein
MAVTTAIVRLRDLMMAGRLMRGRPLVVTASCNVRRDRRRWAVVTAALRRTRTVQRVTTGGSVMAGLSIAPGMSVGSALSGRSHRSHRSHRGSSRSTRASIFSWASRGSRGSLGSRAAVSVAHTGCARFSGSAVLATMTVSALIASRSHTAGGSGLSWLSICTIVAIRSGNAGGSHCSGWTGRASGARCANSALHTWVSIFSTATGFSRVSIGSGHSWSSWETGRSGRSSWARDRWASDVNGGKSVMLNVVYWLIMLNVMNGLNVLDLSGCAISVALANMTAVAGRLVATVRIVWLNNMSGMSVSVAALTTAATVVSSVMSAVTDVTRLLAVSVAGDLVNLLCAVAHVYVVNRRLKLSIAAALDAVLGRNFRHRAMGDHQFTPRIIGKQLELVETDGDFVLQVVDVIVEVDQRNNRDKHDQRAGGERDE